MSQIRARRAGDSARKILNGQQKQITAILVWRCTNCSRNFPFFSTAARCIIFNQTKYRRSSTTFYVDSSSNRGTVLPGLETPIREKQYSSNCEIVTNNLL